MTHYTKKNTIILCIRNSEGTGQHLPHSLLIMKTAVLRWLNFSGTPVRSNRRSPPQHRNILFHCCHSICRCISFHLLNLAEILVSIYEFNQFLNFKWHGCSCSVSSLCPPLCPPSPCRLPPFSTKVNNGCTITTCISTTHSFVPAAVKYQEPCNDAD